MSVEMETKLANVKPSTTVIPFLYAVVTGSVFLLLVLL
jgi:hypothetical protein